MGIEKEGREFVRVVVLFFDIVCRKFMMVWVFKFKFWISRVIVIIVVNEEGIVVVSLGRKWMIVIVKVISFNMRSNFFCGS